MADDNVMDTDEPKETDTGFTVIGEVIPTKREPVKLPDAEWVRTADSFHHSCTEKEDLTSLQSHVSQAMMDKLIKNGIDSLFPVQHRLIPFLLRSLKVSGTVRPRDVCVSSPTGSGKTLSFVIPIIEYLKHHLQSKLRAVIVIPVGELGTQILSVFTEYAAGTPLKVFCSTGKSFLHKDMERLTRTTFDVLITTPGRLHELITKMTELDFHHVEILVMDEADRLDSSDMDRDWLMEFEDAVNEQRNASCPCCADGLTTAVSFTTVCSVLSYNGGRKAMVKWLFSATLSTDSVDNMRLFRPKLFMATPESGEGEFVIPAELTEKTIPVDEGRKPLVVWYLLQHLKYRGILCFTGSLENTHRLALLLKRVPGINAAEFSSGLPLKYRNEKLKEFREGKIDIIICSDIMARGLDVESVQYVLNYDAPRNKTAYIHRIGRTARAGKTGCALTMTTNRDQKLFKRVLRQVHGKGKVVPVMEISDDDLSPYVADYEQGLKGLQKVVKKEEFAYRYQQNKVTY